MYNMLCCCVEFLNASNEPLSVDYKHMLAMVRNKDRIFFTDTFSKNGDLQLGSSVSPAYQTSVQQDATSGLDKFWCC